MAKRARSGGPVAAPGPAARLTDEMLIELLDTTRARLDRAHGGTEVAYAAALAELELEAAKRGLKLPSLTLPERVDRPEDGIPPIELALGAGTEEKVWQVLGTLGPDGMYHAWQVARAIREAPLRLDRLIKVCLVLDRRVFGEDVAEQRHRSYALFPAPPEARIQLVNDAIAATFALLRLRG